MANVWVAGSEDSLTSCSPLHAESANLAGEEADRLLRIADIAERFSHQRIRDDARFAAERIAEGRFYVACVGQFKRGKSTLLNALIGEPILPSGVVPVTTVPTILRFGKERRARVRLRNGEWTSIAVTDIEQYVSEVHNPENRKRLAGLEVFVPSPLLADGMCLVDTPGVGSVFAGNTAATHAFVPHIDAAIVVIGSDPPIAGDELALVDSISQQVPGLLFVLNKADRVSEAERSAAVSFATQVLENKLQRPIPTILEISALEQLTQGGDQRAWDRLVGALERLSYESGRRMVHGAAERSLQRLSSQLLAVVREERDALTRPFEESEKRIRGLAKIVAQAEPSIADLAYIFTGEERRLSEIFGERRHAFLKSVRETSHCELDIALKSLPRTVGPRYRRFAMKEAQAIAYLHIMPWLESEKRNAEEAYHGIAQKFSDLANEFLAKVRSFSAELAALPNEVKPHLDLRARSEFQFYDFIHLASPASPLRYTADLALGAMRAHWTIDADAREFLDRLLDTNTQRVRNDLDRRVAESKRVLETEIRGIFRELTRVAEQALVRARNAHSAGAEAVESSVKSLVAVEAELAHLTAAHSSGAEP